MLLLNGIPMLIYGIISKNGFVKKIVIEFWMVLLLEFLQFWVMGLVVWSMQFIEVAYVSSIREISIVLATIISLYILKEKDASQRIIPSIIIVRELQFYIFK